MQQENNHLSPKDQSLLKLLQENGLRLPDHYDVKDIGELLSREVKDFFSRLTSDGLAKLLDRLYQKGHLHKDNRGWFKLAQQKAFTDVSIVGRITAGRLEDAIHDELGFVRFEGTLNQAEQLFAFRVDGDSMIEDEIFDGDCVLLRSVGVSDGQIGAVVVNGETTLKRIYRDSGYLRLVPSNPRYDTIHVSISDADACHIIGRLEAVISKDSGDIRWISSRQAITEINLFLN